MARKILKFKMLAEKDCTTCEMCMAGRLPDMWQGRLPFCKCGKEVFQICGKADCPDVARKIFQDVANMFVHAMDVARKNVQDVARKIISVKRVDAKLWKSRMGGLIFRY